jgi:hypothetical protein
MAADEEVFMHLRMHARGMSQRNEVKGMRACMHDITHLLCFVLLNLHACAMIQ